LRDTAISTTIPSTRPPSSICTTLAGMARPSMAPAMELADASTASGSARRRLPRPPRSSVGPAASALASATSRPGAAHEVQVKREEAADDGHEQRSTADAGRHRHDAHQKTGHEQAQRPRPPGHRVGRHTGGCLRSSGSQQQAQGQRNAAR
jgi:hypothetical protein